MHGTRSDGLHEPSSSHLQKDSYQEKYNRFETLPEDKCAVRVPISHENKIGNSVYWRALTLRALVSIHM